MHIPDGFLSPPVAVATLAVAGTGLFAALRAEQRDPVPVPAGILGSLAAFVFAAQMINVPVAPGTSGHLVGATLVAMIVGPWRATLVMAAVLVIQAALFQDGGLTALGANLIDMGFTGAFVGFAVASIILRAVRGLRGYAAGAVVGAFAATLAGAVLTAFWLGASGLYPLRGILPVLLVSHAAIGVLEAALTAAILGTVLRWRPDLIANPGASDGPRRPAAMALGLLGVALLIAGLVAPFASSLPDGLERAAIRLGFASRGAPIVPGTLEGNLLHGPIGPLASVIAALTGTILVAALAWAAAHSLSRVSRVSHR
ncbi:MAG: energy-coupling factor ABC transporter permease [Gemmatimonadota bacterium]|jgi:cobalt/nickel transport system permease protein